MIAAFDAAAIRAALDRDPAAIARQLLGDPNLALSTKRDLRFGSHGSLSVMGTIWYCHEVGTGGDMLDLIRHVRQCDFPTALQVAADLLGGVFDRPMEPVTRPAATPRTKRDDGALVATIWQETVPATGTIVEAYLGCRGLALPRGCMAIRFHPACPRGSDRLPAMVAAMRDIATDELCGLHRTFLKPDGSSKAPVEPQKMVLGRAGGAALKLSPHDEVTMGLHIAEGIESGLALLRFGLAPTWALGSAGAIRTLPVLDGVEALTIAVDNDASGTGDAAALACAARQRAAGREVRLIRSPTVGEDLADLVEKMA
jgi:hypothetical protein